MSARAVWETSGQRSPARAWSCKRRTLIGSAAGSAMPDSSVKCLSSRLRRPPFEARARLLLFVEHKFILNGSCGPGTNCSGRIYTENNHVVRLFGQRSELRAAEAYPSSGPCSLKGEEAAVLLAHLSLRRFRGFGLGPLLHFLLCGHIRRNFLHPHVIVGCFARIVQRAIN